MTWTVSRYSLVGVIAMRTEMLPAHLWWGGSNRFWLCSYNLVGSLVQFIIDCRLALQSYPCTPCKQPDSSLSGAPGALSGAKSLSQELPAAWTVPHVVLVKDPVFRFRGLAEAKCADNQYGMPLYLRKQGGVF